LALAECRLARARRVEPAAAASGVQVFGDATVAFVLVPSAAAGVGLAFCRALLDDTLPVDDDLVAAAIARAALAADDADWLYPGPVLLGRARRALLLGPAARGEAGIAAAVQALEPPRLRDLLRQPVAVTGLGLGAVPADVRAAAAQLPLRAGTAPPRPARAVSAPPPGVDVQPHARVDGPFAAVAFVVPAAVDRAALAVAVEVARARAARDLRLRGGEARARAPVVAWSWLHDDPLLLFCRRGANGRDLSQPQAELAALLADLRDRPPTDAERDVAVRTLRAELALAPPPLGAGDGVLPGRAVAALLAPERGIDDADVTAVTAAAAHAALVAVCDPGRAWRGGLVPLARPR
jgi:hypothetical protein